MSDEAIELAREVRAWRGEISQRQAAERLGISPRTYQGIEQGRGFAYPSLLRLAISTLKTDEAAQ
jgi:transcriptional regulator with XRE-family HTH domain